MHQEQVDMVAGDFNGAARRRRSGNEQRRDSILEEAFANTNLPGEWSDVCGFIKPPSSETEWHNRMHGAFEIPHETLRIKHTDQSCHHEVRIHLLLVNARLVDRASRDAQIGGHSSGEGTVRTNAQVEPRGKKTWQFTNGARCQAPTKVFGRWAHRVRIFFLAAHVCGSVSHWWVVLFWPCALDEDDNERPKSHTETRDKNRESCFGWVVWQNQLGS